jgi:DNA-directed RNA polymerase specialized sigma24 family protein
MSRMLPGENEKIDNINRLVSLSHSMNVDESKRALDSLLTQFKPMILKLCDKWSKYFQDDRHSMIQWDILISDAEYWFIYYTTQKYTINGSATYNKFIKDHMDSRIRFIYETELKYRKQNLFPDPDKNSASEGEGMDIFEDVINKYGARNMVHEDMDMVFIDRDNRENKEEVCGAILTMVNDINLFTDREKLIFTECIISGHTHDSMSKQLGISRTRVSQIMAKIRRKINETLDDKIDGWRGMIK